MKITPIAVVLALVAGTAVVSAGAYTYNKSNDSQASSKASTTQVASKAPSVKCHTERVVTNNTSKDNRVASTTLGGVIGGVAGHQVSEGSGKDVATAVGAVAGAMIGHNAGKPKTTQSVSTVERCEEG